MSGTSTLLSGWFAQSEEANGPEQDLVREDVLSKCYKCIGWAVSGDSVAMKVDGGVVIAEVKDGLVHFDYNQENLIRRVQFWMNKSSVSDLGRHLRSNPGLKCDFDVLFAAGIVRKVN